MSAATPTTAADVGLSKQVGSGAAAQRGKQLDTAPWAPAATAGPVPHKFKAPAPLLSPWLQDGLRQRYPPLLEDLTADVVVVGAGLAGLSTAYRLVKAGKRVVVLESRLVGLGSAGRGLGQLSTWVNDTYREVERIAGLERARQVAEAHAAAVAFVRQVVREEGIECELQEVEGAVQVEAEAPTEGQQQQEQEQEQQRASRLLREELAACCRAGVEGARIEFRQVEGLPRHQHEETLVLAGCLNLHPLKYLQGLAEAVTRHGGRIFELTRAKGGLVTGPSGGVVRTMTGHIAWASEAVILATHSPINRNQLWVHDRQIPKRDYVVAIEVPKGSVVPAHFSQLTTLAAPGPGGLSALLQPLSLLLGGGPGPGGRHSVRLAALPLHHLVAGEGGGGAASSYEANKELLLVRGEMHHQGHDEKQYGDPWGNLERWARARFPMCGRTLYCWSGSDYYPADMLGLYGRDPLDLSRPPVYILTGHGGQEWTGATLGSEAVAGEVLGGAAVPRWAEAYRPSRVIPGAVGKYTSELALYFSTVGVALLKHVVPRSLQDVVGLVAPASVERSLKPGEGRVAQHGLLKKALYRDSEGLLHLHSALCTHLGCCVEWNPLDKTFDCPCHGSQYDACGKCIHAPAVGDLEDLGCRP